MGATTLLDIIGSIIVGGVLLLILFRLQATASETSYDSSQDLIVQQNLTTFQKSGILRGLYKNN